MEAFIISIMTILQRIVSIFYPGISKESATIIVLSVGFLLLLAGFIMWRMMRSRKINRQVLTDIERPSVVESTGAEPVDITPFQPESDEPVVSDVIQVEAQNIPESFEEPEADDSDVVRSPFAAEEPPGGTLAKAGNMPSSNASQLVSVGHQMQAFASDEAVDLALMATASRQAFAVVPTPVGYESEQQLSSNHEITRMQDVKYMTPNDLEARGIIYPDMDRRHIADRFRELRTKLLQVSGGENFILMFNSIVPRGGASFMSLNLAAAFCFDQTKTALLIDCNLRNPALHEYLGIEPHHGLTDYLEEQYMTVDHVIHPSGIPRLRFIPAGQRRESPREFFSSSRMRDFLEELRTRYPDRFIILDGPAVSSSSADVRILSGLCDYAIMVVPYGRVTTGQIENALEVFAPEKVVGVVLNN